MTTHKMKLATIPFEKIASGKKLIESRLFDEKRQQINPKDRIEFVCSDDPDRRIITVVRALYRYADFESLFSDFPPELFGWASKKELIEEIGAFYSKKDQDKYGVVGIKIEVVK